MWLLHRLEIQDKHRLPLVTLPAREHVSLDFGKHMRAHFSDCGKNPSMRLALRPSDRDISDGVVLVAGPLGVVLPELAAAVDAAISALAAHLV